MFLDKTLLQRASMLLIHTVNTMRRSIFTIMRIGLNGKTPAEVAGIQVKGENKWLTIIQNAAYPTKSNRSGWEVSPTER